MIIIDNTCGIYIIKNIINNKMYIGQSKNINERLKKHIHYLNTNKHWNQHLQNSWNKKDNKFEIKIIEECKENKLNEREIYWINYYDSLNSGYNKTNGGDGIKNYKHTLEAREKISQASKKRKLSPEHKQKLLNSIMGRKKSKEELKKLSEAAKGRNISEWHKQQLRKSRIGIPLSEEYKRKLSVAAKNRKPPKIIIRNILTEEQKNEIKNILLNGQYKSILQLSSKYNVSRKQIYNIIRKHNINIK